MVVVTRKTSKTVVVKERGQQGIAATISPGIATALPPGSQPTVSNSGTRSAAVFDFGIPAGLNGSDGAKWRNGSGAPSNGLGANGDYYLNTANGDVYTKAAGSYTVTGNIRGPQGIQGERGTYLYQRATASFSGTDRAEVYFEFEGATSEDAVLWWPFDRELERQFPQMVVLEYQEGHGYLCEIYTPKDVTGDFEVRCLIAQKVQRV